MMDRYDIVVAGYLCLDLYPEFRRSSSGTDLKNLLIPGSLIEIEGLDFMPGGVVANTGLALNKFNKKVFLNGLVGDDFIGKIVKDRFERSGLSEGIEVVHNETTALSIVIAPPGVDRIFLESVGCNKIFDTSFINYCAIAKSRLFHFGYPPLLPRFYSQNGMQLYTMFSKIDEMGVVTSLDFSLPDRDSESGRINWLKILKRVFSVVDIFVPSLEEALFIMFPSEYEKIRLSTKDGELIDNISVDLIRHIGQKIIDSGVKIVLLKMAHRGIYLITGDIASIANKINADLSVEEWNYRELWINAYNVENLKSKNASGSGDIAVAGFLSSILDGNSPEYSIKFGAIAGRNNLYCNDIFSESNGLSEISSQLFNEPNEIVDFKS